MGEGVPETMPRSEVIGLLTSNRSEFPNALATRLEELETDVGIPFVDSEDFEIPDDCLVFSTADAEVHVFHSIIEGEVVVVSLFDLGERGVIPEDEFFNGLAVRREFFQLFALKINHEERSLEVIPGYIPGFSSKARKMIDVVQFGKVSWGDSED